MQADSPAHYQQERIECSIQAANHYHIPPVVLLAVAEQEGGRPGQKVRNRNGTYDYGVMQINTVSLADLRRFGINENHVLAKGCYPYYLAAWRLAGHLENDPGDLWQRAANYHSRTPYFNQVYRAGLLRRATKIAQRLGLASNLPDVVIHNLVKQAIPTEKKEPLSANANFISAYSAPIRVKGFDSLSDPFWQMQTYGSSSDDKFSWPSRQGHPVNGW